MTSLSTAFDQAASDYDQQLNLGIGISGETADYFVHGRIDLLDQFLGRLGMEAPNRVMDFGCGTGNAIGPLLERFPEAEVIGVDCSTRSLQIAQARYCAEECSNRRAYWFEDLSAIKPASVDLVYTSGVFHHISPEQRQTILEQLLNCLRPGGMLALFENNPWNPGTRWVMSRIPFDRDAICLAPTETKRRVVTAGFRFLEQRFCFFFPRTLRILRPMEKWLRGLPLGAQYVTFASKPLGSTECRAVVPPRSTRASKAFTLLEVCISLALTSFLMLAIFQTFWIAERYRIAASELLPPGLGLSNAMMDIQSDLDQRPAHAFSMDPVRTKRTSDAGVPRQLMQLRDSFREADQWVLFSGSEYYVAFRSRLSNPRFSMATVGGLPSDECMVVWWSAEHGTPRVEGWYADGLVESKPIVAPLHSQGLVRTVIWRDGTGKEFQQAEAVCKECTGIRFCFMHGESMRDRWLYFPDPGSTEDSLPEAIQIKGMIAGKAFEHSFGLEVR